MSVRIIGTPNPEWETVETTDAATADAAVRAHFDCAIIDTQSFDFTCYSCSVTVRYRG